MLKKMLQVLGALFVPLVILFVGYFLSRSVPDVRYTLSEKIPVSFLSPTATATSEIVQQIEVKNIGNAEAKRVVVRIKGPIIAYEVTKYSSADAVQIFGNQQPFEVVYPQLPPQGGFKLIFKSLGNGVEYRDLAVSHDTGVAHEALAKTETGLLGLLLPWISLLLYLGLSAANLRTSWVNNWKLRAKGQDAKGIVQLQQPWYIWDKEWGPLRRQIIIDKIRNEYVETYVRIDTNLQRSAAYQLLSVERPDHIDNTDWNEMIEVAVRRLGEIYSYAINTASLESQEVELLQVKRPQFYPSDKWSELEKKANNAFKILKMRHVYSTESARRVLLETKPEVISQPVWEEYVAEVQDRYYWSLLHDLEMSRSPYEFVEKSDLGKLDDEHREKLRQQAISIIKYKEMSRLLDTILRQKSINDVKPDCLENWEWEQLTRLEKSVQESLDQNARYKEANRLLDSVVQQNPIGETKPDKINDSQWVQLKRLEKSAEQLKDVESMGKRNSEESSKVAAEVQRVSALRDKIERQLRIIQEILSDPTTIDRIEKYDDSFAPGNLENLRKVAMLLSDAKG